MHPQEILRALQAGELSIEEAKKELIKMKTTPGESSTLPASGLSPKPGPDKARPAREGIQKIRSRGDEYPSGSLKRKDGIAIIGISGRYPEAGNLDRYWDNLAHGKNSIREIPWSRWDVNQYYDPRPFQKGKVNCKWMGLLEDIEYFDPLFFMISSTEAEFMDPQHRLFLQEGYKAFEDAGYARRLLSNKKCGVYLGIMSNEYGMLLQQNQAAVADTTGNSFAIAAARIPYFLNLKGPAIPIDTACSSSLVATHLACQALLHREIDMALVGGVSLYLTPESYIGMCAAGMLSPEGQCKTFDNNADGFVPGEGVGALVLKRLQDAEHDNDSIYGVIIGSGINQDGKTNGITAPSVNSQIELEREIYDKYNIHPESISYVEMHGTGTKLGDPIELEALSTVFKEKTNKKNYCAIGSVKSNIGHTSAASGAASMHKVLLCLKHKKLAPTLNYKNPNEHFNFEDSPFSVNTELKSWDAFGSPRRACVSSFGFSGTNAHIIIEEYVPETGTDKTPVLTNKNNPLLFVLSAKSKEQLTIYADAMKLFIASHEELDLADMPYTLQTGREAMEHRLAFSADSRETVLKRLEAFIAGKSSSEVLIAEVKKSKDGVVMFEADEDAKTLLETWIQKKKLKKVAELWVKGLNIDWSRLYGAVKPHRISLPTYPFAKERYWIPEADSDSEIPASPPHPTLSPMGRGLDELLYLPAWEEQTLTAPTKEKRARTVLIVYSASSRQFEKTIRDHYLQNKMAEQVIQVELGNRTGQVSADTWICDSNDPQGFETCLHAYGPIDCLYFIPECKMEPPSIDLEDLAQSQQRNEIQLLRLVKYLKQKNNHTAIDCYLLTQDKYRVADARINPYGGGTTGLGYSIAQGDDCFSVRNIDISLEDLVAPEKQDALLKLILTEGPSERGAVVKYQNGRRYHQAFLRLDEEGLNKASGLKKEGVYVIVGGSGTLGAVITRYLIQEYAARVVWIGRKPETSDVIREKIESLAATGKPPVYIQADVTDAEQMKQAVEKIKRHYPKINGAIFSGIVFTLENSINTTNEKEFLDIFNVKAKGSINFYRAFQDEPLDFMCCFSSVQAYPFTEAADSSAYAAGITFSDGFIEFVRSKSKFPIGTINWGFWKTSIEGRLITDKIGTLEEREGFHCLEQFTQALQRGVLNQVVCSRASRVVRERMNIREGENISIYEKRSDSIAHYLKEVNADEDTIASLIKDIHPEELQKAATQVLFTQIRQLAPFSPDSTFEEIDTFRKKAGIIEKYDRWLKECLELFETKGWVRREHGRVKVHAGGEVGEKAWKEWESIKESYIRDPAWKTQITLVDACLRKVPEIVTGKILATDVLFPDSSMDRVEGIYKNNALADYFNGIVSDVVEAYVKRRIEADPQTKVRIIEAGAGTGGASAPLFGRLKPYALHIDYCYTDISKSFLLFAEEHYGSDNPYLSYKLWNIEQPFAEQEIEAGGYDIAIGANVVHATNNIRQTLRNMKAALRTNGILLLHETTEKNILALATFGLLDGWWSYEDEDMRIPGSPLLHPETWERVLNEEGFRSVYFPIGSARRTGQHIIVAESNGVIRRRAARNPVQEGQKGDPRPALSRQPVRESTIPVSGASDKNIEGYVKSAILDYLSKSLKVAGENIDSSIPFSDYGVDSIIGVSLVKRINEGLGIPLNSAALFDYTTIDRLAGHIVKTYKEQLGKHASPASPVCVIKSKDRFDQDPLYPPQKQGRFTIAKENTDTAKPADIAVIGMAGQFPDAPDVHAFWQNLIRGHDAVRELPAHYVDQGQYFSNEKQAGKTYCKWGGILEDRDCFDPLFFNISPREAESMNPHQRLILQESWKALEDAGINPKKLGDSQTGIFIGAEPSGYLLRSFTGYSDAIIASRLSYYLDLKGPALVVNTGCSSSGVAIHLACESLRHGESSIALAGGVHGNLNQTSLVTLSEMEMLSHTGKCNTFDESADGTILSEGVAVVVLKRLEDAIAAGDHIYGVIRGSGVNQDGASNGITAPNGAAQERLIGDIYKKYGIDPEEITCIEAHGTGTKLGDPVEANALVRAFKEFTRRKEYCAVGSAKSHIGHTGAAAGVIGLIKIVLSLRHHTIPGLINFKQLNRLIEFKGSPFYVSTELSDWSSKNGKPLTAALNSFGHSGTNVHLVIQEYPDQASAQTLHNPVLVPLSAKNKDRLRDYVAKLAEFLKNSIAAQADSVGIDLSSIAYTLQTGREAMEERLVFLVKDIPDLLSKLEIYLEGREERESFRQGRVKQGRDTVHLFSSDDDMREAIGKWIAKGKMTKIGELWAQGYAIDWDLLYGDARPGRISLPTYPFARERYWAGEIRSGRLEVGSWRSEGRGQGADGGQTSIDSETLIPASVEHLKALLAEVTNIPVDRLDSETRFEEFGLDSVMIAELNKMTEQWVGKLDATLFFKYNSIGALGAYFVEAYPDAVSKLINKTGVSTPTQNPRSQKSSSLLVVSSASKVPASVDIAIIGIAGRYPQAATLDRFWKNLYEGKDCIEEIPPHRWSLDGFFEPDRAKAVAQGLSYSKWGGFLENIDRFDPLFFNISPRDAMYMDPQERLFLETAWECLEDAGYTRRSLEQPGYGNQIGVFVGATFNNYQLFLSEAALRADRDVYAVNSQMFSIANRVSFIMNFTGPSLTVDTACSSSLYAFHLACESIRSGQSRRAIAGGVNLSLHPSKYIAISQGQFNASDGRCRAFCEGGTGYVPAEAVGAVFLKPLQDALDDDDLIYGIIKGSAVSHAGRTNGYAVPNPVSQSSAIEKALAQGGVHPRSISCIEAHGTGTALGDPIEITGLTDVFKKYTDETGFCSISSVKSNIGHAEAAAGIAQLTKVLLQFKHRTLVKNVMHGDGLNPNIDFTQTPFIVQATTEYWKRPVIDGREVPRRAGVSSFGAGGANAHVVIEEYIPRDEERPSITVIAQDPAIIVLSAKNEERLKEQAVRLLAAIRERQFPDAALADIAYTLQVGREAMEERLAVIAQSIKELEEKLEGFVEGRDAASELYRGQVKRNKETLAVFTADEDMAKTIEAWIAKRKYTKLIDIWVKGLIFDWNKLYGAHKPRRISLPTYPFAQERYWAPEGRGLRTEDRGLRIHPLLHQNTSDLSEQRFSSTFTGREFFLADHVVKGKNVLPGVAYLEMAWAAVNQAADLENDQTGIRFKNIVWARPITINDHPVEVHIGIFPEDNGEIFYEVYSGSKKSDAESVMHSQGSAVLIPIAEVSKLDIKALEAQCSRGVLSPDQCYEAFKEMGIAYGPGHQGIEKIFIGEGQALAKLSLPFSVLDTQDQFFLHPSIMDSAFQASIGLMMGNGNTSKPALPFALQELDVLGKCTPAMWALIRRSNGCKAEDKVQKLDIDLCDDLGNVRVRMKGFSSRVLEGETGTAGSSTDIGMLMLEPRWKEQVIKPILTPSLSLKEREFSHLVMLCEPNDVSRESIEARMNGVRCISLESEEKGIGERFRTYAAQAFEEIKNILKEKPKGKVLVQIVVSTRDEQQLFSGLSGLLKTAQLENPKLIGQLIEVEPGEGPEGIAEKLKENSRSPLDNRIRHQDGKRWIIGLDEVEASGEAGIPWKDQGVYLITGGAGGLGFIFVKEISARVKAPALILTGRTPLSDDKRARLKELEASGARIEYKQVDVTQKEAVDGLIQSILAEHGSLSGIIHAAGLIRDNFILKKTGEELREILSPKVAGLVTLDLASRDLDLDFFVLFSSLSGAMGNPGQADYSMANAFMDGYARYRNTLIASNQRKGRTLSISWPLWKEGGMHVDRETEKLMFQTTGIVTMQTGTGMRALYQALASGKEHVMVMEGNVARMKQKLLSITTPPASKPKTISAASSPATGSDTESLREKVQAALMQAISKLLKVKVEDIDADTELNEYGFDSVTLTEFGNGLNQEYELELAPTIFFEHPTVRSFSEYLVEEHHAAFASKFSVSTGIETPGRVVVEEAKESTSTKRRHARFTGTTTVSASKAETNGPEPIAVIGMSGRFPMAGDINQFWKNLAEGKDCITEIPKERWDWREYYGDPLTEVNKTNIKWGGFIHGVDEFDPLFFGISPREAEQMDPQQRLLMMYVWKAIEDAGYSAQSLWGTKTAIFAGTASSGYGGLISKANLPIEGYSSTGMVSSVGPNRMSYFLNIHGPSEPVETACSSSLVAIHRAVSAIESGHCETAIVGGINTIVSPELHISFNKAGMLCEDGRCKTFSNRANGYVRGEGAGMLFLKKLKDAEQDGDHIYGVIRGTAENHGGRANSLTAPNPKAQAELLQTAYTRAGIDPRTVTYIEAHGTGTELGDPIEINALKIAFKELYKATGGPEDAGAHCGLGSVKTNIGHLELAAGIAGVIKVLLQLKHRTLAKTLHCDALNPYIRIQDSPFYIVTETKEWKALHDANNRELPRRAGVSSFGFGGVNAHVVIEEYIPRDQARPAITVASHDPAIIVLSAKNEERLKEQAEGLLAAIREGQFPDAALADIAYTLQVGREAMEERLAVIAGSVKELEEKLDRFVEGQDGIVELYRGQVKRNKETPAAFGADEDMAKTIDAWTAKRKYPKLLDLWVKGLAFDWNRLYGDDKPRRTSLPTYPFARERYWVEEGGRIKDSGQRTDKPHGISLRSLSPDEIVSVRPTNVSKQAITLSPPEIPSPRPGINNEPKSVVPVQTAIPMGPLQEELAASLAEALYMKRSDVDVNKKFIDIGLDSIIGVEWMRTVNKKFGMSIPITNLYDYPTIREFAAFLGKELSKWEGSVDHTPLISAPPDKEAIPTMRSGGNGNRSESSSKKEVIAIVGMSGRYPGAHSLDRYWDNLANARNSIREIPRSRWDVNAFYHPAPTEGKTYCKWIGLLDDIEYFDPLFFMISPAEAAIMDPQHRLFLQEGYKAFADAGYGSQSLSNKKCGVYIGIMGNEYGMMLYRNKIAANTTGNTPAVAAARIPYYLNLKGPAIPIDTACSSSLVATHLACQALLNREIDMALIGGVSLYLTPESYISMCAAGMLSPEGRCKSFDNGADGFVPGEGVGALVLKRLKDAKADHDSIYGVIIGSGINQNGKTNGITAPSVNSQIELEREIYSRYDIHPENITYAEMHGTGTKLGDLIELNSLSRVFKERTDKKKYCAIGSVKTNIGHTSAAAGVASMHKVLLCLRHKKLPPILHYKNPNEHFNFDESPFYVNTELKPWDVASGSRRCACVSSFGFSGSNAHIVIEEYQPGTGVNAALIQINGSNPVLFVLSAKSKEQLRTYAETLKSFLEAHEELNLADMAYTLQIGREAMDDRLAFIADSMEIVLKALEMFVNNNASEEILSDRVKSSGDEAEDMSASLQNALQKKDLRKAAELWVKGSDADWNELYGDAKPRRISLPACPFARERHWIPDSSGVTSGNENAPAPEIYVFDEPYLKDHTVYDEQVLIGVTHAGLAISAFFEMFPGEDAVHLHRLNFIRPIEVKKDRSVEVRIETHEEGAGIDFQALYRNGSSDAWNAVAAGRLRKVSLESRKIDIEGLKGSLKESHEFDRMYTSNPAVAMGESFKTITQLYAGKDLVLARVALHQTSREEAHRYALHPHLINSPFLAVAPLLVNVDMKDGFLPFGIKDIYFQKTNGLTDCWALISQVKNSGEMILFDADLVHPDGRVVAHLSGCSVKRLRSEKEPRAKDRLIAASPASNSEQMNSRPGATDMYSSIQKYLIQKIGQIMPGCPVPNPDTNLMDLGLESSQLVALTAEIEKETKIELNPTLFFEYPSIKALTNHFFKEQRNAFAQLSGIDGRKDAQPAQPDAALPGPALSNTNASKESFADDIAIIGMHGMFPEAPNLAQFWDNLCGKKDLVKEIPRDHWDYRPWYDANPEAKDKIYCKWGSFIDDVDKFDAGFFNISPREAEWMDPQLRLLLQSIYAAGEDAGCINRLRGTNTGVFVGVCSHDYADRISEMNVPMNPFIGTGISQAVIANRVSFYFDLTGPSMSIDTACSSSLFALHSACQALRNKECNMVFVAGVNLLLSSFHYRYFCSIGALSLTGRCHTFDEAADGYVPGECIGSILLKPLKQAKKDGDRIYAVIKGSAALHGGYTPSLTAPSVSGEENVILKAWDSAGIDPGTLTYIEAHGTGTKLGDPIEINSLKKAFSKFTGKERFCAIGTVKANIGHTEGAAGIAGIIKVILQMQHGKIPPLPRFKKLNPYIQLEKSALYINQELEEWKSPAGVPRRAGVSAFGFSGAYAHAVLEEYIPAGPGPSPAMVTPQDPAIIVLSARSEERLKEHAKGLLVAIRERQFLDNDLADIAYTLQIGREAMEERLAFLATSPKELEKKLESFVEGRNSVAELYRGQAKRNKETLDPLGPDEELQKSIDSWIAEKKYGELLELWAKGLIFDWNRLYGAATPRRVSLPTYPFARKRHWAVETEGERTDKPSGISLRSLSDDLPLSREPESPVKLSSTVSPGKIFLSQPVVNNEPKPIELGYAAVSTESLEEELATSLAEALYMNTSEIDIDKKFVDMGLDSIIGVEWIKTVNNRYGISITATKVYDHPSVREFAGFLEKELNKPGRESSRISLEQAPLVAKAVQAKEIRSVVEKPLLIDVKTVQAPGKDGIAIVGISGRYPGAGNLDRYWDNLAQGKNSIREIPRSRWDVNQYYDPQPFQNGKVNCKWMGLLEDIEYFDPLFFMISPTEAEVMDPQHRLFLQEGYKAFEDAGYGSRSLSNKKCGVYLGIMNNEYGMLLYQNQAGAANTTGNSFAIAAARIPYFLNLKGPAIPIDTACSSSLVATHLACQALLNHEIDMALVGGVSLYLTPESYLGMCAAGMLSPEGQCKTFDNNADGFVPGEGVGALVLKRLKDAERDNDSIYGVIIGSGINQDGKTNGITAPSVNSQIELEREIYDKYNIDPESISYVEMHGTGTKLGDPIELEALSTVFKERTNKKNYCAIGSVKSNIGHTSAASGAASMHKVLLCLKHKKLAPTLNYKNPNEHFNFEDSPFSVNTELKSWDAPGSPRRACVSSFGFSGTNAHIIIEEYRPRTGSSPQVGKNNPVLFTLSAKNKEQLTVYAENMKSFIEAREDINLADMAYTLQVGREAMDSRLAVIVDSKEALLKALNRYVQNGLSAGVLTGQVKKSKEGVAVFEADEDARVLLKTWVQKKKLKKIAELWVKGLDLDWNGLYDGDKPRRINLPTYPFARERYWMTEAGGLRTEGRGLRIHPLLHQNTSDFSGHRFSSTFTGEEFFLADHIVNGKRVFPGVGYIEMARAAIEYAAGTLGKSQTAIRLKNIVWVQPVTVNGRPVQVHIGLYPEENGEIAYEIYSRMEGNGAEPVIHSQGSATLNSVIEATALDIKALQAACNENSISAGEFYELSRSTGLEYGPGHRGIETVYVGPDQVLAKLSLPAVASDTQDQYVLHPGMMDSALQASIVLLTQKGDTNASFKQILPEIEEVEILGKCTSTMWSFTRRREGNRTGKWVEKLDVDLCDEQGTICVRVKGFSSRALDGEIPAPAGVESPADTVMLTPVWDVVPVEKGRSFPAPTDRVVIIGGTNENRSVIQQRYPKAVVFEIQSGDGTDEIAKKLEAHGPIDHILWIAPQRPMGSMTGEAFIEDQGLLRFFRMIKALLHSGYGSRDLGWSVVTIQSQPVHKNEWLNPADAGLHGLAGSMAKEYPRWKVRLIDIEADAEWPLDDMFSLPADPGGNAWGYRGGEWYRQKLISMIRPQAAGTLYKPSGVYVVIGGAGGIGEVWSDYMIRTYQARIVWIGRREKDAAIQAKLDRLATLGPTPHYISADATDLKALQKAYEEIKTRYSPIHGVIHSAIVLSDQSLANMEEERFKAALSAKVDVSVRLAQVFQKEPLDFVLFFSSLISFTKSPGQSNYASGCTFKDAFARQLGREWPCAVKVMNWGYWGSAGVVASKAYQDRMAQAGIGSIEAPEAMDALELLLVGPMDQVALWKTTH